MLKKILVCLSVLVGFGIIGLGVVIFANINMFGEESAEEVSAENKKIFSYSFDTLDNEYEVYQNDSIVATFQSYDEAYDFCVKTPNSVVRRKGSSGNIYENMYCYTVSKDGSYKLFSSIAEAFSYADEVGGIVYDNTANKKIYERSSYKGSHQIQNVPRINQFPELSRGCEITSLCMLLNFNGVNVDKMTLANEIFKDNTPYAEENGIKIYANPNVGFVGDIYSKEKKGYGVYHKPIYNLLKNYCPDTALDITGASPKHLYYYIDRNCPVWAIANTHFEPLPKESFERWYTSEGEIMITYSEHCVLLVGYDDTYVYFNDPMDNSGVKKAQRSKFEAAWQQMGSQAITIYQGGAED